MQFKKDCNSAKKYWESNQMQFNSVLSNLNNVFI